MGSSLLLAHRRWMIYNTSCHPFKVRSRKNTPLHYKNSISFLLALQVNICALLRFVFLPTPVTSISSASNQCITDTHQSPIGIKAVVPGQMIDSLRDLIYLGVEQSFRFRATPGPFPDPRKPSVPCRVQLLCHRSYGY